MYSKITIEYMVETIAFTIENFVFAYLGLWIAIYIDKASLIHVGFGMLGVLISRPLSVFWISSIVNWFKKKSIPISHQVVLSYSGIRGAVAFYLVISMTFLSEVSIYI
jgi:sodium/hydrogen exchanger 8